MSKSKKEKFDSAKSKKAKDETSEELVVDETLEEEAGDVLSSDIPKTEDGGEEGVEAAEFVTDSGSSDSGAPSSSDGPSGKPSGAGKPDWAASSPASGSDGFMASGIGFTPDGSGDSDAPMTWEGFGGPEDIADLGEPDSPVDFVEKAESFVRPSPSDYVKDKGAPIKGTKGDDVVKGTEEGDFIKTGHGDDDVSGGAGDDVIRSGKGDDVVTGDDDSEAGGDDWLRGGHGDDTMDGGVGNDVVDGEKGDDTLIYTLSENAGSTDYYDGGKGSDSLTIRMTAEEYEAHADELAELETWIAETANPKRSGGHAFNDKSAHSDHHPVFETSFGLNVRNFEDLSIEIVDSEPEPSEDPVVIDLEDPPSEPPAAPEPITLSLDEAAAGDPVAVSLMPGTTAEITVTVDVGELPNIYDVFLVQDLSGSFYDDIIHVRSNFSDLHDGLAAEGDVAFGVGSFVDKPLSPFGYEGYSYSYTDAYGTETTYDYPGDYVYNTDMGVTTDKNAVQATLDGLSIYSGADWQEAQLEALVQTALRDDEIGFRDGAQKFVVLSTDADYHEAGDLAAAGYDGPTNNYDTYFDFEDYPEAAIVGSMLADAGITPVFAVTEYTMPYYQSLVDSWGFGAVTQLSSDSSNLVSSITEGLMAADIDLGLEVNGDDYGYVTGITPDIYEDVEPGSYSFTISMEIPADSISYSSDMMTFEFVGYGSVDVEIEVAQVDAEGGTGDDTLFGAAGPNGLWGMEGDDVLDGRGGNDVLTGGEGADTLTGGAGDDIFVLEPGGTGEMFGDLITDFGDGADSLQISAADFGLDYIGNLSGGDFYAIADGDVFDSSSIIGASSNSFVYDANDGVDEGGTIYHGNDGDGYTVVATLENGDVVAEDFVLV